MRRIPALGVRVPVKQGKFGDECEGQFVRVGQIQQLGHMVAHSVEPDIDPVKRPRHQQYHIARPGAHLGRQPPVPLRGHPQPRRLQNFRPFNSPIIGYSKEGVRWRRGDPVADMRQPRRARFPREILQLPHLRSGVSRDARRRETP